MRLTRLELNGFKSFADSVNLTFEPGITAIVGPNGCGKSNISDAVRWVLGEQRVSLLRGTRMDEVIFQGSVKRRPINLAEVALVFDNEDGALSLPYTEVVVTRRLSRSGQSDYLLNQAGVRLKDLQDVLRGTGLGSDAGVVIEAKMMDRLLSDQPDERRSLFEEAAGIGLYRDRRATTERRLEQTSEDLQRLDDVISEVATQVRSLARQRGKAERHTEYTKERFAIVMTLTRADLTALNRQDADLKQRSEALRIELPHKRDALTERGRQREKFIQERATAEASRGALERQLGETRLMLQRLESDLSLSAERLEHQTERKQRATEERAEVEARAERASQELEAASHEQQAAEEARQSVQGELDLRTANEEEVKAKLTGQRDVVRELEEGLQHEAETLRALAAERAALERDLEDLRTQDAAADTHRGETEQEFIEANEEHERLKSVAHDRARDEGTASSELERTRDVLVRTRERELRLRAELRQLEDTMALDSARKKALEELERKREGLAPGARALLEARARFGDGVVLGPLSDYLRPATDQAQAAEHLLGDWLHAVLVRDRDAVAAIKSWHVEAQPGPLLLLPQSPAPAPGGSSSIMIDVDSPADRWVQTLLADTVLDTEGGVAVTRSNGAVFLPAADASGVLSRRAELETLTTKLNEGRARLETLTNEGVQAANTHQEAEQHLEAATEEAARTKAALREAQGQADDTSRRLLRSERERNEAAATLTRLRERLTERQHRLQGTSEELTGHEAKRVRLADQLTAERAALAEAEAAQESARERRVHWQVEEAQVSAREEAAGERERRAREELEAAERGREALSSELGSLDDNTGELRTKRAEWEDALAEGRVTLQQTGSALEEAVTSVQIAGQRLEAEEGTIEEARAEIDRLGEELHHIELELTQAEGRRTAIKERVEAEWHKPLEKLLASSEPVDRDEAELRARDLELGEKIEAMGPVNPLAVQEHAEEVARLEFLTEQRDDLVAARASLMQALKEIDETARAMFVETFDAIRKNFHNVFHTLFEGGECDVLLANESDPLTSDIDIQAAPRGKRIQRIHLLSSGERALVAISLLFSIYLTKPAPFCLLDEVDAPLDDANVMRFVRLLDEFKADTQFIVITHNPRTMQVADAVYGVTMQEPGVSTIVGVRLGETASVAM